METTKITTTTVMETKKTRPYVKEAVVCIETGKVFATKTAASRDLGCCDGALSAAFNGGSKATLRGKTFCYLKDYKPCAVCETTQPECDDLAELKRKAAAYDAIMAQREMTHRLADLKTKRDKIETEIKNLEQQLKSLGGIL